jgi:hypothetical protein
MKYSTGDIVRSTINGLNKATKINEMTKLVLGLPETNSK